MLAWNWDKMLFHKKIWWLHKITKWPHYRSFFCMKYSVFWMPRFVIMRFSWINYTLNFLLKWKQSAHLACPTLLLNIKILKFNNNGRVFKMLIKSFRCGGMWCSKWLWSSTRNWSNVQRQWWVKVCFKNYQCKPFERFPIPDYYFLI